ncbi:MAG TPA: type IV toxin-antitoxin system AbiEi family antitoxin domain-containing protein [Acidimicrobiales bacterium]|jgi:very-short-patch-repair endonuclease|nr:type IV toxin-antitoxin system AbiEi family antitoxin domain-containing protein [Acidimicrobiales bacterium]
MSDYPELDKLAKAQHGLVSVKQCEDHDLSEYQLYWFSRTGAMIRVRRGIYRWCGAMPSSEMMAMAAVMAAGRGAALSHRSAGRLWGLLPAADERVEVSCARWLRLDGVDAHQSRLVRSEVTKRFGIPVTTPARTLLDLSESCSKDELGRTIDEALRRQLTTIPALEAALRNHEGPGRRRREAIRGALGDRGVDYDPASNDWERRMQELCDRLGLPPSKRQHPVRTKRRRYLIDRAIIDLKIGIEFNGRSYHGLRSGFDYDSQRRNDLTQAGWLMLDFTTNTPAARIEATIRSAVDQRTAMLRRPA